MNREIFTGKNVYDNLSITDLLSEVCVEGQRPSIPEGCPTALKELIKKCWEVKKEERPSFAKLIEEKKFENISANFVLSFDKIALNFWCNNFFESDGVPLDLFCSKLFDSEGLSFDVNDPQCLVFQTLLVSKNSKFVSIEDFSTFVRWFGPMKSVSVLLKKMMSIASIP